MHDLQHNKHQILKKVILTGKVSSIDIKVSNVDCFTSDFLHELMRFEFKCIRLSVGIFESDYVL